MSIAIFKKTNQLGDNSRREAKTARALVSGNNLIYAPQIAS